MTAALPLVSLPLMLWIALSPVILVEQFGFSSVQYGLAQFPVLGGLIIGNLVLLKIIDKMPLGKTVLLGVPLMLFGTGLLILGLFIPDYFVHCLIIGTTCISLGEGVSFSVLYRFALMSSEVSKGTVAATVSIILMLSFFVVIEAVRMAYEAYDIWAYCIASFILIALWFTLPRLSLKQIISERKVRGEF